MFNYTNRHKLLLRFITSYILVLIIPLVFFLLVYNQTVEIIKKDIIKSNLVTLAQTRDVIDRRMSEVERVAKQLAENPIINYYSIQKGVLSDGKGVVTLRDILSLLSEYEYADSFIQNIMVFFGDSNSVIVPQGIYLRLSSAYGKTFQYGDMTFDEWKEFGLGQFYNEKTFAPVSVKFPANPPKDEWMLSHIQSFPNNRLYRPKGFVSIFVSQKQLHQMLQPSIPYGGYSYLLNDSGSVLASVGDDKFAKQIEILDISFDADNQTLEKTITSGERMIVSYVVSPYNQWKYVTVTPAYSVIDKARYITQFIWVFMFIALIVGVVISCLMAYKNSKPISKMIRKLVSKKLEKGGAGRGAFDFLTNSIDDLIVHNEEFQTKINQQIPYLKMLVYNFLLENRFKDEQELLFVSSQAEIKLPGGNFTVLVAQLYETKIGDYLPNNMKYLMVILNELVVSNLGPDTIIQNIDFAAVALILNLDEENNSREKLERILKSIQDLFIDKYSCRIVFAGGVTVDNWLYIWSSYEQAKNALDYKGFGTDVVVRWHDKIPQNGSSYFYSVDTESKLITLAKAVDYAGVKKLFGELYIENFVRRHLSVDMMEYFIYDLKGTIVKIVDQVITEDDVQLIQMKKEIDKLHSLNSIEEIFEEVINIYGRICSIIDSQKRSHNTDLADKIIAYLKLNYMEPISLNCVASIFNINEVYLSQFFKEQTGVNFSRFIEQLRIEQSCELLCNTDMTVDHIASQVGYGNRHSYRKAFQRVKGENPSRYKELNGRSAESSQ